jgi:hypothetical protein
MHDRVKQGLARLPCPPPSSVPSVQRAACSVQRAACSVQREARRRAASGGRLGGEVIAAMRPENSWAEVPSPVLPEFRYVQSLA